MFVNFNQSQCLYFMHINAFSEGVVGFTRLSYLSMTQKIKNLCLRIIHWLLTSSSSSSQPFCISFNKVFYKALPMQVWAIFCDVIQRKLSFADVSGQAINLRCVILQKSRELMINPVRLRSFLLHV